LLAEVEEGSEAFRVLVEEWGSDTPHRAAHLSRAEVRAARDRLGALVDAGTFPMPGAEWPSLPWPPM
jgi:quinol monooxygenase YgiN